MIEQLKQRNEIVMYCVIIQCFHVSVYNGVHKYHHVFISCSILMLQNDLKLPVTCSVCFALQSCKVTLLVYFNQNYFISRFSWWFFIMCIVLF